MGQQGFSFPDRFWHIFSAFFLLSHPAEPPTDVCTLAHLNARGWPSKWAQHCGPNKWNMTSDFTNSRTYCRLDTEYFAYFALLHGETQTVEQNDGLQCLGVFGYVLWYWVCCG